MSDDIKGLIGSVLIIYAILFEIAHLMASAPNYFHWGSLSLVIGGIGLSIRRKWGVYTVIVSMGLHLFYTLSFFNLSRSHIESLIFNPLLIFQLLVIICAVGMLKENK